MRPSQSPGTSHGICAECVRRHRLLRVESPTLSPQEFEALPYGAIELDRDGRITAYNRRESELSGLDRGEVLGRRFFGEVAPCTRVAEFEGRYRKLVAGEIEGTIEFAFVFAFRDHTRTVTVSMSYDPERERGTILIHDHD